MLPKVLIQGAGEHASGTAHRLSRAGFRVVMTDLARPQAVRLTVSFCTAILEREIVVEGVRGVRHALSDADMLGAFNWDHIPVFVDPDCRLRELWQPDVLIDARLLKRNEGNRVGAAPLTIGLGPGLEAGRDVDYVVETQRGHNLGRIISHGFAAPDTGIPGPIAGYARERLLRSPADGTLRAQRRIGDKVAAGEVVATVDGQPVPAAIDGMLRGLVYPDSPVVRGQKVGDIDPRGDVAYCYTLSDKTRTISGSVLEIAMAYLARGHAS